jgi:predicted transcriptional regulator
MKTAIHTDGFEGWKKRARKRALQMDAGKKFPAARGITFESASEMARLLTPARITLFETVRNRTVTMRELAEQLGRDVSAVRRDVLALERFGIVLSEQRINPGHGRARVVSAPSRVTISAQL